MRLVEWPMMSKVEHSWRASARTTDSSSSFHGALTPHATTLPPSSLLLCALRFSLLFATSWDKSVRLYDCDNNVLRSKIDAGCVEHNTVLPSPWTALSLFFPRHGQNFRCSSLAQNSSCTVLCLPKTARSLFFCLPRTARSLFFACARLTCSLFTAFCLCAPQRQLVRCLCCSFASSPRINHHATTNHDGAILAELALAFVPYAID